jgi:hypothetical protein
MADFFHPSMFSSDALGLGQHNPAAESIQSINPQSFVANLDLEDVVKLNPHVKLVYQRLQDATDQVVKGSQLQQKLYEENFRLTTQLTEFLKSTSELPRYFFYRFIFLFQHFY